MEHYGGCDGVVTRGVCLTERRYADEDFFPRHLTPKENPFYLSLPYDDVNDARAAHQRERHLPWAHDPQYEDILADRSRSLMKNRWVEIRHEDRTCFAQVQDAGPGKYFDPHYVFGDEDARPLNQRYGGSGTDVSPALNGCLGFTELNGTSDRVDWRFVERRDVPDGPWTRIETTRNDG